MAVRVQVSSLEDVMVAQLAALTEPEPNFGRVLEWSRALREQIDWDSVRAQTETSPFARVLHARRGVGDSRAGLVPDRSCAV